jgi:NTP pyrophosphatase (non-canonical NTP hydrolase)
MTELAEAIEAHRKGDMENLMEEMADIFIRLLDLAGAINMDVESEIQKKMAVNLKRPPKHGKAY